MKIDSETALRQIKNKNYESELKQQGYEKIIKIGMDFFKKDVEIIYEK